MDDNGYKWINRSYMEWMIRDLFCGGKRHVVISEQGEFIGMFDDKEFHEEFIEDKDDVYNRDLSEAWNFDEQLRRLREELENNTETEDKYRRYVEQLKEELFGRVKDKSNRMSLANWSNLSPLVTKTASILQQVETLKSKRDVGDVYTINVYNCDGADAERKIRKVIEEYLKHGG